MTLRTDSSYTASNTRLESAASALQCSHQFQHRSHPNAMIGQFPYPGCANRRVLTSLSGLIVTVKLFVITLPVYSRSDILFEEPWTPPFWLSG